MTLPRNALKKREGVRAFARGLPGAVEEFSWGESVAKVNEKVFAFLGAEDGSHPMGVTVQPKDETARAHALACSGAEPSAYGLGKAGWVSIPLVGEGTPAAEVLCEWVEERYRVIAPKRLTAALDGG